MKHLPFLLITLLAAGCAGENPPDEQKQRPAESRDASDADAQADSEASAAEGAPKKKGRILYYRNPMGLPDTSPVPKKDSMGMDYIPVYESDVAAEPSVGVAVSQNVMQTIGVRTSPVRMEDFGRAVSAFGAVEENTRLQSVVAARVDGWIEGLAVTAVGDAIEKGDLLFRLYSPDLIAAQQDFLVAAKSGSDARAASAARRLKSLGLQDETIAALKARGSIEERAPVYADRNGVVSALDVREGAFVRPGGRIAAIQDYSEVWVIASLAEQDLAGIRPGLPVNVDFPNIPGAERKGSVDYVYPTVDPKTRTGAVRIVLDNEDDILRPGAYANVLITVDAGERLAVPSEAVLRDSRGAHVVIALGEGRFAPAEVETGIAAMGVTEIISGLEAGDEVVVSGQFLIDSESSLRESFRKMTGSEPAADHEADEHKGHH